MKTNLFAVIILGACTSVGVGTDQVQAAAPGTALVWGSSYLGLTNVPAAAQSDVPS